MVLYSLSVNALEWLPFPAQVEVKVHPYHRMLPLFYSFRDPLDHAQSVDQLAPHLGVHHADHENRVVMARLTLMCLRLDLRRPLAELDTAPRRRRNAVVLVRVSLRLSVGRLGDSLRVSVGRVCAPPHVRERLADRLLELWGPCDFDQLL